MNRIERVQCGKSNCYIISGNNNAVLVDTSLSPFREKILGVCKNKNIKLIILTHGHIDHINNAAYLSEELEAPIAIHKADYNITKDNKLEPLYAHNVLGKLVLAVLIKGIQRMKTQPFEPEIFLYEGLSLKGYGVNARIIELPGHTKGSIGIIVGETDIIVGDALMNIFYPCKSMLYENRKAMEQSAKRISEFSGFTIYFGHGKPVINRVW